MHPEFQSRLEQFFSVADMHKQRDAATPDFREAISHCEKAITSLEDGDTATAARELRTALELLEGLPPLEAWKGFSRKYAACLAARGFRPQNFRRTDNFSERFRRHVNSRMFLECILPNFDTLLSDTEHRSGMTEAVRLALGFRDNAVAALATDGVFAAGKYLDRGLALLQPPRRPVTDADRESELWAVALHESGHCAAAFVYGSGVEYATVVKGNGGEMLPKGPLTRESDRRITAAGYAVTSAYGFGGGGLRSDFSQLEKRGIRAVRTGDSYDDGFLPFQESNAFKTLRDEIRKDLAPHERQIRAIADELYSRVGEKVSGRELRTIWNAN